MLVGEPSLVEVSFHRELRGEQTDLPYASGLDLPGRGVGDVQQRDAHGRGELARHPVHDVGA